MADRNRRSWGHSAPGKIWFFEIQSQLSISFFAQKGNPRTSLGPIGEMRVIGVTFKCWSSTSKLSQEISFYRPPPPPLQIRDRIVFHHISVRKALHQTTWSIALPWYQDCELKFAFGELTESLGPYLLNTLGFQRISQAVPDKRAVSRWGK